MENQKTPADFLLTGKLTREEIHQAIKARVANIDREFTEAFEFIGNYGRSVTFFGSARMKENDEYYKKARALAGRIIKELGYTILTGGGGGIMEASNRGAFETGGESVGLNITLPKVQRKNSYLTHSMELSYFFVRKTALSFAAEAYVFFPGGFGTLDEFFEIVTLIQTGKIPRVPIILVGREYWEKLTEDFIRKVVFEKDKGITKADMDLYEIVDDDDKIIEIIKRVPIAKEKAE